MSDKDIDFVIAWVDGSDPEWKREKEKYWRAAHGEDLTGQQNTGSVREDTAAPDSRDVRYRDGGSLRYWFRAVEKYAPWVRRVHLVTCGQKPSWLNTNAPKLDLVFHRDFIPEKYLPTFSSHPIELNMHRIPGLTEQFVYFNDDFYLTAPVRPTDFFVRGLPCDSLEETPREVSDNMLWNCININDLLFANRHFARKSARKEHPWKWYNLRDPQVMVKNLLLSVLNDRTFFGLNIHHLPASYLKSTCEEVWAAEPELMDSVSSHKFRDQRDVSQVVFKYWQLLSGKFYPYNKSKYGKPFPMENGTDIICDAIRRQTFKYICINDSDQIDFDRAMMQINAAFQEMLPEKSAFEL